MLMECFFTELAQQDVDSRLLGGPDLMEQRKKEKEIRQAFLLDAAALHGLVEILIQISNPLEFTLKCKDGTSVSSKSLEEVLAFPNETPQIMTEITVSTPYSADKEGKVSLRNGEYAFFYSIKYEVRGQHKDVVYLSDQLEQWALGIRQRYSPWPMLWPMLFSELYFPILGMYLGLLLSFGLSVKVASSQSFSRVMHATFYIAMILPILWLLFRRFFPIGSFAIGSGKKRETVAVAWRNFLVVGMGVGVLASILGTLIFNYFH